MTAFTAATVKKLEGRRERERERAYKVRFQVGALIQGLYRLLRRNNGSWCSTIFFGGGSLDIIMKGVKNAERGDDSCKEQEVSSMSGSMV